MLNLLSQFSARQIEKTSFFIIFTIFTINFSLNPDFFYSERFTFSPEKGQLA